MDQHEALFRLLSTEGNDGRIRKTIPLYWPVKLTLIVFGNWAGLGWQYRLWTLLLGVGYAGVEIAEVYWWYTGDPSIVRATSWPARISELAYFNGMAFAFGATTRLLHTRLDVIEQILEDRSLLKQRRCTIVLMIVFVTGYVLYSLHVYTKLLDAYDPQEETLRYLMVAFTYLWNLQYGAAVMLYCLCCQHYEDVICEFTSRNHGSFSELKDGLEHVCLKLRNAGIWNNFLGAQNLCALLKLASVLSIPHAEIGTATFWLEFNMMVRSVAMVVFVDLVGASVVERAGSIHEFLTKWRSSEMTVRDATPGEKLQQPHADTLIQSRFEHLLLLRSVEQLGMNNFDSLQIFGIGLSVGNLVRFSSAIGGLCVHTAFAQSWKKT